MDLELFLIDSMNGTIITKCPYGVKIHERKKVEFIQVETRPSLGARSHDIPAFIFTPEFTTLSQAFSCLRFIEASIKMWPQTYFQQIYAHPLYSLDYCGSQQL